MKTFDTNMTDEGKEEMIKNGKKVIHDSNASFIGLDDTFDFECQRCGQCCMNRGDIILNSFDVYRASKKLGITPEEFLSKYTTITLGGFSKIPMVLLGQQSNGMCHFLDFDYYTGLFGCTINDSKPGACANHPIGLITRYKVKDGEEAGDLEHAFIKVDQCENSKKPVPQKVRDWVKGYLDYKEETDTAHSFLERYNKHYNFRKAYFLTQFLHTLATRNGYNPENDNVVKVYRVVFNEVISYTYANYDTNKPYIEQAEQNIEELEKFLTETDRIFETVENVCNKNLFSEQDLSIDAIIKDNDKDGGANVDIGGLAQALASNTEFKKEDNNDV